MDTIRTQSTDNIVAAPTDHINVVPESTTMWKLIDQNSIEQTDNAAGDENNQIIYVTYQDPNDPNGKQTLQMLSQMVINL